MCPVPTRRERVGQQPAAAQAAHSERVHIGVTCSACRPLAAFGPVSLVAFVLVSIGLLALALTFGALAKRISGSGGPYVYAKAAFGEFAGFLNA